MNIQIWSENVRENSACESCVSRIILKQTVKETVRQGVH